MELEIFDLDWRAGSTLYSTQLTTIEAAILRKTVQIVTALEEELYVYFTDALPPNIQNFLILEIDRSSSETESAFRTRVKNFVSGKTILFSVALDRNTVLIVHE